MPPEPAGRERRPVALVAGDVFLHAAQLTEPTCRYAFDADDELAVAARRRLEILRAGDAYLGTAHLGRAFIRADALD